MAVAESSAAEMLAETAAIEPIVVLVDFSWAAAMAMAVVVVTAIALVATVVSAVVAVAAALVQVSAKVCLQLMW